MGHNGLLRVFSFTRQIRHGHHLLPGLPRRLADLGFAGQFNVETW